MEKLVVVWDDWEEVAVKGCYCKTCGTLWNLSIYLGVKKNWGRRYMMENVVGVKHKEFLRKKI